MRRIPDSGWGRVSRPRMAGASGAATSDIATARHGVTCPVDASGAATTDIAIGRSNVICDYTVGVTSFFP